MGKLRDRSVEWQKQVRIADETAGEAQGAEMEGVAQGAEMDGVAQGAELNGMARDAEKAEDAQAAGVRRRDEVEVSEY